MNLTLQRLLIDSKKINLLFWIIISIGLIVYKLSFHELWKDEWQAWLVARDLSLSNMLAFMKAGATSLGIGSELFDKKIIQKRDSEAMLNHFTLFAQQMQLSK